MRSPLVLLRRQSLRVRVVTSFVVAALVLTLVLSAAVLLSVRTILENNRVKSSTRQSVFVALFSREFLATNPDRLQRLVSLLQARENFDAMATVGNDWFSTALDLTPEAVPADLRELVARDRFGYQPIRLQAERSLVFGAPLPQGEAQLYLFYSMDDIDATMSLLARVLILSGLAILGVSVLLAQRVSRRILRPLANVSSAARRVAEGLLETRVEALSSDEVGTLAASFNRMTAAFQEMLQRERRFVAAVSHELRTPLAALQATSQVLAARKAELPPSAREAAEMVAEDVQALRVLVEELLEISDLDARRATVRWEAVDLRALAAATARRRHLELAVEGSGATTWTDKARVERIVGNLIDNAVEHGGGAGVRVRVAERNGRCEVAVSDRGPGIDPVDLPHLFERFYKADQSRGRDRGGIGLGLAIAAQNARLLGGTLVADSRAGEGATFTLGLPLRLEPPAPTPEPRMADAVIGEPGAYGDEGGRR